MQNVLYSKYQFHIASVVFSVSSISTVLTLGEVADKWSSREGGTLLCIVFAFLVEFDADGPMSGVISAKWWKLEILF